MFKIKRSNILLLFACLLFAPGAIAQNDVNLKFGKPTKEEMEMTTYKSETPEAVVLCRLTNVNYTVQTNGYIVDYNEKVRIKVLRPEGARFATVTIPYSKLTQSKSGVSATRFSLKSKAIEMDNGELMSSMSNYFDGATGSMTESAVGVYTEESVEDLKATAFNMENGKVVKSKLKSGDVVREQVDDATWQVKFTIPDVKQGTVIEYEYCLHSQLFWQLHDWYAQCEIPVAYACLDMEIPNYLIFNIEEHGLQRLNCSCVTGTMRYKLESDAIAAPVSVTTNHYTCVGRDLKAIPKDSYVWNEQDYCAGITAELKSYSLRGTMPISYAKTWEQIDRMILDDEDLGKALDNPSPLADELKAKVADITDERQRAAEVYNQVMSRVRWNGTYALWPNKTSETLKKGEGTNADINLLLIQSLRSSGIQAWPVVLRSRDMGLLPYNFPSISKLSTCVVGVALSDGQTLFADGSAGNGGFNVLPAPLLVERARMVAKGKSSKWVNLQKLQKAQTSTVVDAVLTADGKLTGTSTTRYTGLAAVNHRQAMQAAGKTVAPSASSEIEEKTEFSVQGEVSDGTISVLPFSQPPLAANPFTATERIMPVEFPSLLSESIVVNITMPEGYRLAEEPKNTIVTTPDKGLEGRYFTSVTENKAQVLYQFSVNKIIQPEKSYSDLRELFQRFVDYSNHRLVFKKN